MRDLTDLIDPASERLGGAVLAANDEWFAPKEGMIKACKPECREGLYTERGRWMDGWETRRRREPGEDCAIVWIPGAGRCATHLRLGTQFDAGVAPLRVFGRPVSAR